MGVSTALSDGGSNARIVIFEPASTPFITKGEAGTHGVEGIGIGFQPPLLDQNRYDEARAIEESDGRAMAQSLTALFASPLAKAWSQHVSISDFRGHILYEIQGTSPDAMPFSLCATGNDLLFGSSAEVVRETILRLESDTTPEPSPMQKAARSHAPGNSFCYGAMDHRKATGFVYITVSDTNFSAGIGFKSDFSKCGNSGKKEGSGENEISLTHLTSFLQNTYHFAEALPDGIHHRIVFENDENQGVQ